MNDDAEKIKTVMNNSKNYISQTRKSVITTKVLSRNSPFPSKNINLLHGSSGIILKRKLVAWPPAFWPNPMSTLHATLCLSDYQSGLSMNSSINVSGLFACLTATICSFRFSIKKRLFVTRRKALKM